MGTPWNGLNRNKPPRKISKKKMLKLKEESKIKKDIRQSANGHCTIYGLKPTAPTYRIEIHEVVFRSAGGKVSHDNSVAICSLCHHLLQRYIFRFKGQCIRIIIMWRKVSYNEALEIYNKIIKFAEERNLLRENKGG
jgi:hypothetical protein